MKRLWCALLIAGCAAGPAPNEGAQGSGSVQAALARVTVDNRTAHELTISFRSVGPQRGRITIGRVPAGAVRRLPPVPASEPIELRAQRPDSTVFELPLRTFELNEEWLWLIPPDAVFK